MPLVLAIEPDPRQASVVERVVKGQVRAQLVLVDSKDAALAALAARIPDLILVTTLMPPRDEDEIAGYLKTVPHAGHVQTLAIPLLADKEPEPSLGRRLFKPLRRKSGKAMTDACAPAMFAEQVQAYLQRAAENRVEVGGPAAPSVEAETETLIPQPIAEPALETFAEAGLHISPEGERAIAVVEEPTAQPITELASDELVAQLAAPELPIEPLAVATALPVEPLALAAAGPDVAEPGTEASPESTGADLRVGEEAEAAIGAVEESAAVDIGESPLEEPVAQVAAEDVVVAPFTQARTELDDAQPAADAPAAAVAAEPRIDSELEPVDDTVGEPAAEEVSEPAQPDNPTRWIWTDVRPSPAMMVFQRFLADSREESAVRGYELRRARHVNPALIAECSVVPEVEQVPEPTAEPVVPEIDTSLWDKLFVALEDRFSQEKAKVASTEAAAAAQARKYIQARKTARRRARKADPARPPMLPSTPKGTSALESLRMDIERVLRKTGIDTPAGQPRDHKVPDSQPEPAERVKDSAARREQARRATAAAPQAPSADPISADEWGSYDPDECGFAAVIAKLDEKEAETRARESAAGAGAGADSLATQQDSSRVAPLSVWARAVTPEPPGSGSLSLDPLGDPAKADPALRLPDDVVAVRYATGCRIGEIHVPEAPAEPAEPGKGERRVVLLSKKLLKKPR